MRNLALFFQVILVVTKVKPEIFWVGEDSQPEPVHVNSAKPFASPAKCETKTVHCWPGETNPSIDGSCNNQFHPTWGTTLTVQPRLLQSDYADSKERPRTGKDGFGLPSARKISNVLTQARNDRSTGVSHLHVLWGQFLAHDFVHTPIVTNSNGSAINCDCENPHQECFNIQLPVDDEQVRAIKKKCISVIRSKPAVGEGNCRFKQREQLNALSSYIDGTMIYGRSLKESKELREPFSDAGELKTSANPSGSHLKMMPIQDEGKMQGTSISKLAQCPVGVHRPVNRGCFVAGDLRSNENTGLSSIHTIWLRYHNKIAKQLKNNNPLWSGDKVFNVARRIVTAAIQIVTFREYLPSLLGPIWMKRFELNLGSEGYWNGYEAEYNPGITTEFSTAAFRYGHSQVSEKMSRPGPYFNHVNVPDHRTDDSFFNSEPLLNAKFGGAGSYMRGFMLDNAGKTDTKFSNDLRNQLFKPTGGKFGGDLFAINIQRGRDHGIPGYNKYREICGLSRASGFSKLSKEISPQRVTLLQTLYNSVDDVDLYVGGLLEQHVPGGEVGPTFACILAYQFRALRKGDRFWHENEHSPSSFSPPQLKALRSVTFAKILCDTGDDMKFVFRDPMLASKIGPGKIVACDSLAATDLKPWDSGPSLFYYTGTTKVTEWTRWFATETSHTWLLDIKTEEQRLRKLHGNAICDSPLSHELRNVPFSTYVQIRFSCLAGTIKANDFPHKVSDHHFWGDWVAARIHSNGGYRVDIDMFGCTDILGIQAMTEPGKQFASETFEVFEKYDVINGFSCRDSDQMDGKCQEYKARVLCSHKPSPLHYYIPTFTDAFLQPTTTSKSNIFVAPTAYPTQIFGVPKLVRDEANRFCLFHGVCCSGIPTIYSVAIPRHIKGFAASWCPTYGICCDVLA